MPIACSICPPRTPRTTRAIARLAAFCIVCLSSTAAASAQSAFCDELWYTRNLIFDRAGHCFQTPLGQAVFDNSDCTGSATPNPLDGQIVGMIRATEAASGCAVDTSRRSLPQVADYAIYGRVQTIPPRSQFESACISYIGTRIELRSGVRPDTAVIAAVEEGANITFAHDPVAGWVFVVATNKDNTVAAGWMPDVPALNCVTFAG
ncbi:MAG: DUF4453 domain-containing protein [Pseudomonadota bacterium]